MLLLISGCDVETTSVITTTTLPPASAGCYVGAFVNGLANTADFESLIGKNLAVNSLYYSWSDSFPAADCTTAYNYGAVPMLTWEPYLAAINTLEAIGRGDYDSYITKFAQDAKAWGNLIYLRFGHEMNSDWYPWSGFSNGASGGPAKYIAAWKHVHDLFTAAGATNVKWVWCPNHLSFPNADWNEPADYYPGSAYVDWIGVDGYNWGYDIWRTFDEVYSAYYATFSVYGKPLMICEFASTENGGSKSAWIADAFSKIKNNYPQIRACVWFNINKERDWRINSSGSAEAAFKTAVGDSYFLDSRPSE